MNNILKCLRCSVEMERGNLSILNIQHAFMWSVHEPQVASLKGFKLLRGPTGESIKAALTRVKASLSEVQAHRCPKCGYVELNAQPNSNDA